VLLFRLDTRSGVAPYMQLVHQVKNALRLGTVEVGNQLPTIKEVVAQLAINPNTVLKAYRELEHEGLIESRPGLGTFVTRTLAGPALHRHASLRRSLDRWVQEAFSAGLDRDSVEALFADVLRQVEKEGVA